MNDHSLNDPQLKHLEARLAAAVPQIAPIDQQQLLYQCAFAAGRMSSRKSLRRWQLAAAALVVLLLGMSIPVAHDPELLVEKKVAPSIPTEGKPQRMLAQTETPISVPKSTTVDLDAWQMPHLDRASFADELAQFQQTDPHLRSLAVGTFTRSVLQP